MVEANRLTSQHSFPVSPEELVEMAVDISSLTLDPGSYHLTLLLLSRNQMVHYDWWKDFAMIAVSHSFRGVVPQQFEAAWTTRSPEHPITASED